MKFFFFCHSTIKLKKVQTKKNNFRHRVCLFLITGGEKTKELSWKLDSSETSDQVEETSVSLTDYKFFTEGLLLSTALSRNSIDTIDLTRN